MSEIVCKCGHGVERHGVLGCALKECPCQYDAISVLRAEVAKLREELVREQSAAFALMRNAEDGWDHAEKLAKLSGRLDNVAEHADDCPARINPQWACICGLDNISSELMVALASYDAAVKPANGPV